MEKKKWMDLLSQQTQLKQVLDTNQYTQKYGLSLSEEDTQLLLAGRKDTLQAEQRVEFGKSILPKIIFAFCDSSYINQNDYRDILIRLQEIFYLYKNEMMDEITDDELLEFMREQYEQVCFGDLDYLEGTCLDIFAQAIRAGYRDYTQTQGQGEFARFDPVKRWDRELYMEALRELF